MSVTCVYRKERRVFDAYALERRSGQEKRDREEIEKLRFQVLRLSSEIMIEILITGGFTGEGTGGRDGYKRREMAISHDKTETES